jgi:LPS-assembly protein
MLARASFWSMLISVLLWSSSAPGGDFSLSTDAPFPYQIKADTLSYDDVTQTYMAKGHVTITRDDHSLSADVVDLNVKTMEAKAFGHVHFTSGEDWLTGTRLEIDLNAGTGTLYEGFLFIKESNFYIRGSKIEKSGKDSYHLADGRFTACDGDSPDWQITAKDIKVTIDGLGKVKHATLWAKSIPVLYTPYLLFPASTKRQSGFLVPQFSHSNQKGYEYTQPLFWAISERMDATFYESYMQDRGFKQGVEYRYVLTPRSKGAVMFDYLHDRQIDDGTETGFQGYTGDDEDRTNRNRWWFRGKADQEFPAGFKAKLDVDVVSDQDYLREFKSGYSGYEWADDYFQREYGRDLDDYTDAVRTNHLNMNRNWDQYSFNGDLVYFYDAVIHNNDDPDPTLQRLPHLQFEGSKQSFFSSPLYFDLESFYDYFWRDYGTRGHYADMHPRLYYPLRIFKTLDFEPSVGLRESVWQVEKYEDEGTKDQDHFLSREGVDLRLDLSTDLTRIFQFDRKGFDRMKHTVKPQVVYDYVTVSSQKNLPDFDDIDRIDDSNLITYSITNFFSVRSMELKDLDPAGEPGSNEEPRKPSYRYNDFCRVKLMQSYDIEEARRDNKVGGKRPFSDVKGEVELRPYDCLDLDGDAAWSPYESDFTSYHAMLSLCDRRGDQGSLDYTYTEGWTKSIITRILLKLFDPVSATWEYERDIKDGKTVQTVFGLRYEPQCWSVAVTYTDDRSIDEQKFAVEIGLYGLGSVGL